MSQTSISTQRRSSTASNASRASASETVSDSEATSPDSAKSEESSPPSTTPPPNESTVSARRLSELSDGIESSTFCRTSVKADLQVPESTADTSADLIVQTTGEAIITLPSDTRSSFSALFTLLQTFAFWLDIILLQKDEDNKFLQNISKAYDIGKLIATRQTTTTDSDKLEQAVKGLYGVLGIGDDEQVVGDTFKKMLYKVIAMTKESDKFLYKCIRKEICVSIDGAQTDGPEDNVMCFVTAGKHFRTIVYGLSIWLQKASAHMIRLPTQLIVGVKNNNDKVIRPEIEIEPAEFTKNPAKTKGNGKYELESMVFHNLDGQYSTVTRSKTNEKWICVSDGKQSVLTDDEWYSKLNMGQVVPDIVVYSYKQLKPSIPALQLNNWRPRSPNQTKRVKQVQAKAQDVFRYFDEKMKNVVGLQTVKDELKQLMIDMLGNVIVETTIGRKTNIKRPVMLFSGSPGTGKTHIATIVAKLLKICEVVDSSRLIVTTRPDLVAQHIGETAPKTRQKIDEARGGTMMVDEAYQLAPVDSPKDYGKEAMHTIMDTIEGEDFTSTDRPAYIFAGYPSKMQNLLNVNAGLLRRITHICSFPNYTYPELAQICKITAERQGLEIQVRTSTIVAYLRQLPTEVCSRLNASLSQQVFLRCKSILYKRIVYTTMKDPASVTKEFVSVISEDILRQAVLEVKEKYNTI